MTKRKMIFCFLASFVVLSVISVYVIFNPLNVSDDSIFDDPSNTIPSLNQEDSTAYVKTINSFAFDLLKQMTNDPLKEDNLFYSPYSVFTALAMTYEGASGKTASEMADVLKIPQDNISFHTYVSSLYSYLNQKDLYTLSTANALWIKENYEILSSYLSTVETYYHAASQSIDFSDPTEAAQIINQWVEDNTNNLIKDLIPPDAIDPVLCRLILTNAIYFKGTWEVQFDEQNTTNRDFEVSEGIITNVPTMTMVGTKERFNYTETDTLQILELPYAGNSLSMVIILPKTQTDLSTVVESIDETAYNRWFESMEKQEVDIYLPTFKIETPVLTLNDYLQNLGIRDAFGMNADFSGITGNKELRISDVLHKAYIDVNEEGTEAAAATAVIMELKSINGGGSSRIVFDCDHPFLFTLHHRDTGTILFMGAVENPSS
ncbi:MAG: serpin family protein [Candidatus Thermoplasmatota archaeon]|nr:serpin family protein [Candidatus Thermoplasmatota archaeon]